MKTPKVSIIIPCYNAELWIKKCVLSALTQTHENVEVICVDNESSDRSVEFLEDIKDSHPELTLSSAPNVYPHCWDEAREVGFELATGDYLITIGADDYLDVNFISNYLAAIFQVEKGQDEKIVAIQSPIFGIRGMEEDVVGLQNHTYASLEEFKEQCLVHCPVNTPSVLFHRDLYEQGLLKANPERYSGAADYDLYCNLADKGIFIYPLNQWMGYYYRWHESQATWGVLGENTDYNKLIQNFWKDKWKT